MAYLTLGQEGQIQGDTLGQILVIFGILSDVCDQAAGIKAHVDL